MKEELEEQTDIEYEKAKLYKRWLAFLIDFILMAMIGLFFFGLTSLTTTYVPQYKNVISRRLEIETDSGLYNNEGKLITEVLSDSSDSYDSKKVSLSNTIDSFYSNSNFFSDPSAKDSYNERKKNAKDTNGNPIFTIDDKGIANETNYSSETYYNFYVSEIEGYSLALLSSNNEFQSLNRTIVLTSVIELIICFGIGYFISYNLIPICSKKGRKSLGMYVFNLSLLGGDGLVAQGKMFAYRQIMIFVIGFMVDIVTIFIPFLVSITMMHLSKSGQDFYDYISGTYVVDTKGREVYRSIEEYDRSRMARLEASLENNDFKTI